ncbi:MFS transporter [Hespellia stercorisuis]|uniref:Predicted arabinose efflux permease, MFS family n=1 Tax=Hespellia stercorisuis DSM 15480 TaxID=1121950 RepID=A0A1M6MNH9_9FIRM|nr:MFS transporter [Hespellia stercorisuis]SHJ85041.1 Predicted arabinose efflux permease, MFS family [Hespellia stercorisuis DSM 15480]
MKSKLFQRNFTMVVIGQIISLFGNSVLRYALPLYLLNQTHSAFLYGIVQALSFLPMLLLAPVGGIIADRVNKRNIMVCLDFSTAALMLLYTLCYQRVGLVSLLIVVLMLLYGIQGAYQPTVQASVPVLVSPGNLMAGNAVINMVSSLSGILGPALGGIIFGFWGLRPVLIISIGCFVCSAVMEIFIQIPFEKRSTQKNLFQIAAADIRESYTFIRHERPEVGKVGLLLTAVNTVFSALIIVGLPIVVNEHLGFSQSMGNQLYGYAGAALSAGGLLGALLSGSIGKRLDISRSDQLILLCTAALLPMGLAMFLPINHFAAYFIILFSCMVMMVLSTLLSIEMITYVQKITPGRMIGKVMALLTCLAMCGNPIGQVVYGALFEQFASRIYGIYFGAFLVCIALWWVSRRVFGRLDNRIMCMEQP